MKTSKKGGPNTDIFHAVAPLERPQGIEIFEKSSEFRDPKNPRSPEIGQNLTDLGLGARNLGLTGFAGG